MCNFSSRGHRFREMETMNYQIEHWDFRTAFDVIDGKRTAVHVERTILPFLGSIHQIHGKGDGWDDCVCPSTLFAEKLKLKV